MPPTFQWSRISETAYGAHEKILGSSVWQTGGLAWRRVRPFFYRPLFTLKELAPDQIRRPIPAWLGAIQHAVPPTVSGNSFLNYLVFERPADYSLGKLNSEKRRRIKRAAETFSVSRLDDVGKFNEQAFPLYLDFYLRTGYTLGTKRRHHRQFVDWAEALFKLPGLLILGAYHEGKLEGICTSFLCDDTLICATLICATESLPRHLPDLLLHVVRDSAAGCPGVARIYQGMYHGNTSLDAFYIERGARILRKPALLQLNPVGRYLLRRFSPGQYRRITGELSDEELKWLADESPAARPAPDLDRAGEGVWSNSAGVARERR